MTINRNKYDGVHFQVAVMNMIDGSVQVHGAGCADLKRGKNFAEKVQAEDVWDCKDREDIREAYNADFDEETDGWYDMTWMPCASHVPDRTEAPAEEPKADETVAVAGVTIKVGRKWTYMYAADGSLIAEIRNDAVDAVRALAGFQA